MHLEFLLEEASMEAALIELVPRILPDASFDLHAYQGKPDLLKKLVSRLRGYSHWSTDDLHIVVVIDRDDQDCVALKKTLVEASSTAGVKALHRIAIEELEAWLIGDAVAICAAYPKVPRSFANRARYRDPDGVRGGTWEALERLLQDAGYYASGLPKVEVAAKVAAGMDPQRNRSRSFQVFRDGLLALNG